MAYNYEWPYTDPDRYNADWLINEMKRMMKEWEDTEADWAQQKSDYEALYKQVQEAVNNIDTDIEEEVRTQLPGMISSGLFDESVRKAVYQKFAGKRVCVIGDSISDNNTNPPNWTTYLQAAVEAVGGTFTNLSVGGYGFDSFSSITNTFPVADIYIIFLGINDFGRHYAWSGSNGLEAHVFAVYNAIIALNPLADKYYISPLRWLQNQTEANKIRPLILYRSYLEYLSEYFGCCIISGINCPGFSNRNGGLYSEGIHPTAAAAPILADYIIGNICADSPSFQTGQTAKILNPFNSQLEGMSVSLFISSDMEYSIQMTLPAMTATDTLLFRWNDTFYSSPSTFLSYTDYVWLNGVRGHVTYSAIGVALQWEAPITGGTIVIRGKTGWNVQDRQY